MADQIRYDLLTQKALRGVVRGVLTEAAKKGLPGDHHFYIGFDTHAAGVKLSDRLRTQYPEQMTIILQHQYWDLSVSDSGFEVGSVVRRHSGKARAFPSRRSTASSIRRCSSACNSRKSARARTRTRRRPMFRTKGSDKRPRTAPRVPTAAAPQPAPSPVAAAEAKPAKEPKPVSGGGEVVRLDRFRKK